LATERYPALFHRVRFELVGAMDPAIAEDPDFKNLPENLLLLHRRVDYLHSLALIRDANGLLLIDGSDDRSVFLPSKLIDYIGAGRPILGLTPPGPAARVIRELSGCVIDPSRTDEIANALPGFIKMAEQCPTARIWGAASVRSRFTVEKVRRQIAAVVAETIAAMNNS